MGRREEEDARARAGMGGEGSSAHLTKVLGLNASPGTLRWSRGEAAGPPRPPTSPARSRAPPTGEFRLISRRRGGGHLGFGTTSQLWGGPSLNSEVLLAVRRHEGTGNGELGTGKECNWGFGTLTSLLFLGLVGV